MASDFLNIIKRARAAATYRPRRVFASLARFVVLGLAALSVLPACAAEANHARAAEDHSRAQGNAEPGQSPEQQKQFQEQQTQPMATATATPAVENNVKPPPKVYTRAFKDLLAKWGGEYHAGRLDLNGPVSLIVEADRTEDGTLENMILTGDSASDPTVARLARDVAIAIGASGVLEFLEGVPHLLLNFRLDQQKLDAVLNAETDSEKRAESLARVFEVGFKFQSHRKAGTDEAVVWNNMKVSASGKVLTLKLEMTREAAGNLLLKQITPD